jgi:hypothetical protein
LKGFLEEEDEYLEKAGLFQTFYASGAPAFPILTYLRAINNAPVFGSPKSMKIANFTTH